MAHRHPQRSFPCETRNRKRSVFLSESRFHWPPRFATRARNNTHTRTLEKRPRFFRGGEFVVFGFFFSRRSRAERIENERIDVVCCIFSRIESDRAPLVLSLPSLSLQERREHEERDEREERQDEFRSPRAREDGNVHGENTPDEPSE